MQSCSMSRLDGWTGRLGWTWVDLVEYRWTWLDLVGQGISMVGTLDRGTWLDLAGFGWTWLDTGTSMVGWLDCWMVGQGEVGWMQRCDPESLLLSVGATRVS